MLRRSQRWTLGIVLVQHFLRMSWFILRFRCQFLLMVAYIKLHMHISAEMYFLRVFFFFWFSAATTGNTHWIQNDPLHHDNDLQILTSKYWLSCSFGRLCYDLVKLPVADSGRCGDLFELFFSFQTGRELNIERSVDQRWRGFTTWPGWSPLL